MKCCMICSGRVAMSVPTTMHNSNAHSPDPDSTRRPPQQKGSKMFIKHARASKNYESRRSGDNCWEGIERTNPCHLRYSQAIGGAVTAMRLDTDGTPFDASQCLAQVRQAGEYGVHVTSDTPFSSICAVPMPMKC